MIYTGVTPLWVAADLYRTLSEQVVGASLPIVIIIVAVIGLHELGHLVAMRIGGWWDPLVFMIPPDSATKDGKGQQNGKEQPSDRDRAVVTLAGPLPGLALGAAILLGARAMETESELSWMLAVSLILFNGFSLLPYEALDGGRFLRPFFRKRPLLDSAFGWLGIAMMLSLGWFSRSVIIGGMGALAIGHQSLRTRMNRVASVIREHVHAADFIDQNIPSEHRELVADCIIRDMRALERNPNPRTVARLMQAAWLRAVEQARPVESPAPLLAVYLVAMAGVVRWRLG